MGSTKNTKVLVFDDEPVILDLFEYFLSKLGYEVTAAADTVEEAFQAFRNDPPDIALLDITTGEDSRAGIKLAQRFQKERPTPIIFVTAYPEATFEEAKLVFPADFIEKPVTNEKKLDRKIDLALTRFWGANFAFSNVKSRFGWLYIKTRAGEGFNEKIHQTDIRYIKASNNDTELYVGSSCKRIYISNISFSLFCQQLPAIRFCQIHRSYYVNLDNVLFKNNEIILEDDCNPLTLRISPKYKDGFLSRFKSWHDQF